MDDSALSRSDRLAALKRQIILDAAERVFARDGLEQTTIRAIAKEAGCTTGAIYPGSKARKPFTANCCGLR